LAIVRQLVDADGGAVALLDAAGGGVDAHVRLPVAPGALEGMPALGGGHPLRRARVSSS
jgi:hypothetical protein